ncbi:retrovirus-related Pol polyprotein from transposon 297 [Nephila pilipes]|uniref:Retrovirus-related Pol polyprotein from transposon 297 n=1 Tax=Nephila pilipes TaxID=299642 RepID=A0A8X6MZQ9_NEPPI|nr:retrovirus-related Pol polyprotein from transposon 297 [Nephila pilipes]
MSLAFAECSLDIWESLAAQYFVDAIRDGDTQHTTRLMDAKDLKSGLAYSIKYEAARTVSKTSKHVRSLEVESDSKKREDKSLFNWLEKLLNNCITEKKNVTRRNPNVTCWQCNKKGHLKRFCQAIKPNQENYSKAVLGGAKAAFSKKTPVEGLKISALSGKKNGLYLEGSICGVPCLMLVDTGANVTLLRTNIAQKLNQQFIYTVPNIFLKAVNADITDPCILDLNFLREFNFTVDLERNEIRTRGEEIPLFSANIEFPKLCSVFAKEKTIIPARSECLIRGVTKASKHFRYAVTNSPSQISEKGVLVAATLVNLKKETIPVRILNMDNKPKTMDKGAIIASYKPVVDIVARPQEFSGEQPIQSILENLEGQLYSEQRYKNCSKNFGTCFPHVTLMSAILI